MNANVITEIFEGIMLQAVLILPKKQEQKR
jgi:hypothetical protein